MFNDCLRLIGDISEETGAKKEEAPVPATNKELLMNRRNLIQAMAGGAAVNLAGLFSQNPLRAQPGSAGGSGPPRAAASEDHERESHLDGSAAHPADRRQD